MNTEISEIESDIQDALEEEKKPRESNTRRGGSALAFFAFLFSLAALGGAGWMWWQDAADTGREEQRMFAEIARLESSDSELSLKLLQIRDEMAAMAAGDNSAEIAALHSRMEADNAQMDALEQTIRDQTALSRSLQAAADSMQGRLLAAEAALAGMSSRELDAGNELDLAEVDYLLRLANERLKLFSDALAADQALEIADMHLAAMDNPMYLGVRQDIAAARRDLAGLELPDYLEIANELDALQVSVAGLSFPDDPPAAGEPGQVTEESWWDKVKNVFSSLVTVRRSTEDENARISLEDKDYVRQRTWLQLEIAHLSLMRRDQQAFRASLERVHETISAWFDDGSSEFESVVQRIGDLQGVAIQVEAPDITAPWSTLRLIRAQGGSVPALPAQAAPDSGPEPDSGSEAGQNESGDGRE